MSTNIVKTNSSNGQKQMDIGPWTSQPKAIKYNMLHSAIHMSAEVSEMPRIRAGEILFQLYIPRCLKARCQEWKN